MNFAPQTVRASVTFKNLSGAAYDPDTVRFLLKAPDGGLTSWTYDSGDAAIVRDALGAYRVDVHLPAAGVWHWRWEADGAVKTSTEGSHALSASKGQFP
jgi:hypothetical protein